MNILTVNCGSSSIKVSVYSCGKVNELLLTGSISDIGSKQSDLKFSRYSDRKRINTLNAKVKVISYIKAIEKLFEYFENYFSDIEINGIGHRIVHGANKYHKPVVVNNNLIKSLKKLIPLAPEHLPNEIVAIEFLKNKYSELKQVACFDTSFHRTIPSVGRLYPLPLKYASKGVIRYGFHGISYEYVLHTLKSIHGEEISKKKIIIAHLGNGSSMASVINGKSIDTTMGFTPAGGLMMGTRTGDMDPAVILYLIQHFKLSPHDVYDIINKQSGLIGISGFSPSMLDILKERKKNKNINIAFLLYCYNARKFLGAMVAAVKGIDILVFTGGIGENSAEVRNEICNGMEYLGINVDYMKNFKNSEIISEKKNKVKIYVIKTNEEIMIAKHTSNILKKRIMQLYNGKTNRK